MSDDLAVRIREFVEQVPPVTAEDVQQRLNQSEERPRLPKHRPVLTPWTTAAVGIAAVLIVLLVSPWTRSELRTDRPQVLSPGAVRLVVDASTAALNSGTAHIASSESLNGSIALAMAADMTFSGNNLEDSVSYTYYDMPPVNEMPHSVPLTAPTTSTDHIVLVDGNVYILVAGEWYVESEAQASNQKFLVPEPATFFGEITPSADLFVAGHDDSDGEVLTHLEARNPSAIQNDLITGMAGGRISAFNIWIDGNNVVQRMTWASAGTLQTCSGPSPSSVQCSSSAMTQSFDMTFSDIGVPQRIVAPSGALPGSGADDDPAG